MRNCMDWRSVKFDWNRARAFLVTAEEGSLSAAARSLGMAQPTLGRQVSALEEELGVVLFERLGKGLTLTPSGLELVEHVRAMGAAATRVSLTASGQAQSVEGTVRITASEVTSAYMLPPIIARMREDMPGITIEIVSSNALSDLRRREADIAIRSGRPTDKDLMARKIMDDTARLYASRDYLDRHGPFHDAAALARAAFIGFDDNDEYVTGLQSYGIDLSARNFVAASTSHLVHWELAKQGVGIGIMASRIAEAEPQMQQAAPWLKPFTFPVWLVAHREVNTSRRVRLVFDTLAAELLALRSPNTVGKEQ